MTRTRTSLNLAVALVAYSMSAAAVPLARRNTVFTDYTGADPLLKKSTLSIDDDTAKDAGGSGTDSTIKTDANLGASADPAKQQLQAENADGGTKQADAIDDAGAGNKAVVGDPPAGSDQQQ